MALCTTREAVERFPPCISSDPEMMLCVAKLADRVAANCSATNGQVISLMACLFDAILSAGDADDMLVKRIAERMAVAE